MGHYDRDDNDKGSGVYGLGSSDWKLKEQGTLRDRLDCAATNVKIGRGTESQDEVVSGHVLMPKRALHRDVMMAKQQLKEFGFTASYLDWIINATKD